VLLKDVFIPEFPMRTEAAPDSIAMLDPHMQPTPGGVAQTIKTM
jgi:hypothetical protein